MLNAQLILTATVVEASIPPYSKKYKMHETWKKGYKSKDDAVA